MSRPLKQHCLLKGWKASPVIVANRIIMGIYKKELIQKFASPRIVQWDEAL
jgi:hypothetical protein